jgi:hypothetical protein
VVVELLTSLALAPSVIQAAPSERPFEAASRGHISLYADDGLNAGGMGNLVKIKDTVHVAVVSDGYRRLAVSHSPRDDFVDSGSPVQHRELSMEVQVDERRSH